MKTLFFFLCVLLILGCVHNQSAFDTVQLSFVEKSTTPSSSPNDSLSPKVPLVALEKAPVVEPVAPASPEKEKNTLAEKSVEKKPLPEKKLEEIQFRDIAALPNEIKDAVKLAKGEYHVQKTITIFEKGILWLQPGTKILFEEAGILCKGTLQAMGNGEDPIVFEGPEGWDNVTLWGREAVGILEYCEIQHGLGMEVETIDAEEAVLKKGALTRGGAVLYANGARGHLKNCIIKKNFSQAALALIHTKDILIEGCEILENDENGIAILDSSCTVVENQCLQNRKAGLLVMGNSAPTIRKNIFRANYTGIMVLGNATPAVLENTLSEGNVGIEYQNNSAGTLVKNTIEQNQIAGIICIESSHPTIEENIIENNRMIGILTANESTPEVKKNTFRRNPKNAFLILEKAHPQIVGNIIIESNCAFVIHPALTISIEQNQVERCQKTRDVPQAGDFSEKNKS